jgi:probable DNA metabolism protein
MNILRYDGSFYSFICGLTSFLKKKQLPDGIERENSRQPSLFSLEEEEHVSTTGLSHAIAYNPEVFRIPGITKETWNNAWNAFLSETPNIEMEIAQYLLLALEKKHKVNLFLTDPRVSKIQRVARRVLSERHRFMGLLRFRTVGENLYYASICPDNFILPILAPFFVERFSDQNWIIHDRKRELAAIYNLKTWTIVERAAIHLPEDSQEEKAIQNLWQCFFDSIAIKERLNLSLQQKHIPKKYWQDLIEKLGTKKNPGS